MEFGEIWQRDDDQPILASKDNLNGRNVAITRTQSTCICAEAPVEDDAQ